MKSNPLCPGLDLQAFADNAPVAIRSFDRGLNHRYVNAAGSRLYGKSVDEIIGKSMDQLGFSGELCKIWSERILRVFQTGQQIHSEDCIPTADGIRFFHSDYVPTYVMNGTVDSVLVVSHDITEIKRTDAELRESRKKFKTLIETTSDFIWETDSLGRYTYCSPQMEKLWGLNPEQMIGKTPFDVMLEEHKRRATELFFEIVKSPRPLSGLESAACDAHGNLIYAETNAVPFFDDDGKLLGFRGISRDITERKRAEETQARLLEQIDEQRGRLQAVVDSLPTGLWIADARGEVVLVNDIANRIWGGSVPHANVKDYELYNAWRADTGERIAAEDMPMARALKGEILEEVEIDFQRFDATHGTQLVSSAPIRDSAGDILGCVAIVQDITNQKLAEQAIRESEDRLREINATLEQRVEERTAEATTLAAQLRKLASDLTLTEQRERQRLAKILHDHIQQLLVAAKLQASILLNRQSNEDLEASAQLVYDLLGQTLSASRTLTAELSPPVLQEAGLGPALQWLARSFFEKHGLQVEVSFSPSGEPVVEDMRAFMFDAVREILFNVVKHSGAAKASVDCFRGKDNLVHVVVSDEGKGFNPALLHAGESSEGFGLFSIQQRIKHMGGRLEIDSAPGQGTRITVIGPHIPTTQQQFPAATQQAPMGQAKEVSMTDKIRIVLADDHHIIRQGLASLLRLEPDIEIVGEASNGAQAINLARSLRPDVVVMDVSMPVINGIEAAAEIQRDLPDIQVVGLSMHEEGELSSAMRQAGAVAYVAKGGPPEALIGAIHKAISVKLQKSTKPTPRQASQRTGGGN